VNSRKPPPRIPGICSEIQSINRQANIAETVGGSYPDLLLLFLRFLPVPISTSYTLFRLHTQTEAELVPVLRIQESIQSLYVEQSHICRLADLPMRVFRCRCRGSQGSFQPGPMTACRGFEGCRWSSVTDGNGFLVPFAVSFQNEPCSWPE
jgi:hypothetical protein